MIDDVCVFYTNDNIYDGDETEPVIINWLKNDEEFLSDGLSTDHESLRFDHHDGLFQRVVPSSPTEPDYTYKKRKATRL